MSVHNWMSQYIHVQTKWMVGETLNKQWFTAAAEAHVVTDITPETYAQIVHTHLPKKVNNL